MFAIIRTGGKQYPVQKGTILKVEKLNQEENSEVTFGEVLLLEDREQLHIGKPLVTGASVKARIIKQGRGKKDIVFKYKNKTRYSVKNTHRQPYSQVEIIEISQ